MHSTSEEQLERSKAIKLLIEKWVKSHEKKPKQRWKSDKYPIPDKKKLIKPSDSLINPLVNPEPPTPGETDM
jgi:hypothetical protein